MKTLLKVIFAMAATGFVLFWAVLGIVAFAQWIPISDVSVSAWQAHERGPFAVLIVILSSCVGGIVYSVNE